MPKRWKDTLTSAEQKILRRLDSPKKIQDYLDALPFNFEEGGETCLSPRRVMREQRAHCMEGALFAALARRIHGHPPVILDLTATYHDVDHIVTPFKEAGRWGAISKTNHNVLRYREPIYRSIHELVLSYFHEYFDDQGRKTLRSYTSCIDLRRFDKQQWMTDDQDLWYLVKGIIDLPHQDILTDAQRRNLRKADGVERYSSSFPEWTAQDKRNPCINPPYAIL